MQPPTQPQTNQDTISTGMLFCCCAQDRTIPEFMFFHAKTQSTFETVLLVLTVLGLIDSIGNSETQAANLILSIFFSILTGICVYFSCKLNSQVSAFRYRGGSIDIGNAKLSNIFSLILMILSSILWTLIAAFLIIIGIASFFMDSDGDGFVAIIKVLGMFAGIIGVLFAVIALLYIGQVINCCKFRTRVLPYIQQLPGGQSRNQNYR